MMKLLFKTFISSFFALVIIFFYYSIFSFHRENFDGYFFYGIFLFFTYIVYKLYYYYKDEKKVIFTPLSLLTLFLLNLFLLCLAFFQMNGVSLWYGVLLFFKILFFLLLPTFLSFLSYSTGNKILSYKKWFQEEWEVFKFFSSFGIGFFVFISLLTIAWFLGVYTLWSFFIITFVCFAFSFKEFFSSFTSLSKKEIVFENHQFSSDNFIKKVQPYLLSSELIFIIISCLLAVNFISVMRPFPIGWDDLGVYMNYARQIAQAWSISSFWQMISWQVFTWIWFLFWSSTQAFFINSFSWLLVSIFLSLFFSSFFRPTKEKKIFFNIPLLMSAIYISLPMAIFHFAKDMKLDQGLFLMSMIPVYLLYYLFYKKEELKKEDSFYFLIIGILLGLAFSIKATSLILISASIGLLFFYKLGLTWFLWFLWIFFAFFTKFHLWDFMNVVYPKNDIGFVNTFSLISFIFWVLFLWYWFKKYKKIHHFLFFFSSLLIGIFIAILPWITYNISSINSWKVNLINIIAWEAKIFFPNYTRIHSQKYLDEIEKKQVIISNEWISSNEDMGRYFWYEKGINNYVKLLWNLTMQVNQKGEFTDISYIFLAFIPWLFLFLPYRKKYLHFFIYFSLLFLSCLFVFKWPSLFLTNIFSSITLPFWYIYFFLFLLINILFFIFSLDLKNNKLLELFIFNLIFGSFYVFLWAISAFWIVWYGIVMYLSFLIFLAFWLYYLFSYEEKDEDFEIQIRFFCSSVIFFLLIFYFFNSSISHLFINLKTAWYVEYKIWKMNENEAIFAVHPEYFDFMIEMNIAREKQEELITSLKKELKDFIQTTQYASNIIPILEKVKSPKMFDGFLTELYGIESADMNIKREVRKIRNKLYFSIINPSKEQENKDIIYRVGTFMKYFVSDNNYRLYDDSLLFSFQKYLFDESDINKAPERIKKLGMNYILVDLNAATIDKSPIGDLTKRYESVLKTFTSEKLELVSTDSMCLMMALEDYKKSGKTKEDMQEYMKYAWVNYDSLWADGTQYNRGEKLWICYTKINNLVNSWAINDVQYPYLKWIYNYLKSENNTLKTQEDYSRFYMQYVPSWFKVLFRIK